MNKENNKELNVMSFMNDELKRRQDNHNLEDGRIFDEVKSVERKRNTKTMQIAKRNQENTIKALKFYIKMILAMAGTIFVVHKVSEYNQKPIRIVKQELLIDANMDGLSERKSDSTMDEQDLIKYINDNNVTYDEVQQFIDNKFGEKEAKELFKNKIEETNPSVLIEENYNSKK